MAAELGIGDVASGFIFRVFALGYALAQMPSGGPRIGSAARIPPAIVIAWSLFTGLMVLMVPVPMLIAVRLLFGLAEWGIYPIASRAIHSSIPPTDCGGALRLLFVGSRVGAAFGLSVVSVAMAIFGWRGTFWALAALGIVLAAAWYGWFRNTPDEKGRVLSSSELAYIRAGKDEETAAIGLDRCLLWDSKTPLRSMSRYLPGLQLHVLHRVHVAAAVPPVARYALSLSEAGAYAGVPSDLRRPRQFAEWLARRRDLSPRLPGHLRDTLVRSEEGRRAPSRFGRHADGRGQGLGRSGSAADSITTATGFCWCVPQGQAGARTLADHDH